MLQNMQGTRSRQFTTELRLSSPAMSDSGCPLVPDSGVHRDAGAPMQ